MDDKKKSVLRKYRSELRLVLAVRNILPALRPLLTNVEYFRVRDREGNVAKVDEMMEILLTKENRHFDGFCTALKDSGYEHWAKKLRKKAGSNSGEWWNPNPRART